MASRTDDPTRSPHADYKSVMTKDALPLPHLLRGEMVSVIGGLWESEAIGSGKASGVVVALGNSIMVVFPRSERHMNLVALEFEPCTGLSGLPQLLSLAGMAPA